MRISLKFTLAFLVVFSLVLGACLACRSQRADTITAKGQFCIGEGYELWSGAEAESRARDCTDPVEGGKMVVSLEDGTSRTAETDEHGRFSINDIPTDAVVSVLFDGETRAGSFEINGPAGPNGALEAGDNNLLVFLPIRKCPLPDRRTDEQAVANPEAE